MMLTLRPHTHTPPLLHKACLKLLGLLILPLAASGAQAGPDIQHWTLESGTHVYFVESRALPLLDIQVDFAAGSAHDPADKAGLAAMTLALLETGVEGLDEQHIADRLADTGAQLGSGADNDRTGLTLRTLSSPDERDAAIALLSRLLASPSFPQAALERERARYVAGLRDALTRPGTLAARAFETALYPRHPYGLQSTEETLLAIQRDDVVAFHRQHFTASQATVSIVGDASREEADAIARQLTGALPQGQALPPLPAPEPPEQGVQLIPHPSAQAHVLIGLPVMSREDPDYYPLLVGNYVLGGGGFVSRLTTEVREKRGFAYSVYSAMIPRKVSGPFQIGLQTRGAQAEAALEVVDAVLRAFIAEGPSETELQAARDNIINGFGLRLDSNRKMLDHVAMIGFYRLPLDWLDAYPQQVAQVTAEAVRDAFARRVTPAHLVTVVAGGDGDAGDTGDAGAGGPAQ